MREERDRQQKLKLMKEKALDELYQKVQMKY
jgi:hypothetical protein